MKDDTRLVHSGRHPHQHDGMVNVPVHRGSTILHESLEALEGATQAYSYGRRATPTTRALEESIRSLEGGARTLLTPSGLSACTAAISAFVGSGDHLLMVDSVYGPTRAFCNSVLKHAGGETTYYAPTITPEELRALIRPNTKALFLESPGSGTFEVQDVPGLAEVARAHGVAVLVDNTWATPLLFKPLAHGADVAILAATKYVVGHADALIGTLTMPEASVKPVLDYHGRSGLTCAADEVYLAQRGLRTLSVRLERHQATGLKLAEFFRGRPEVARVLHPAFEDHPGHAIWRRDFKGASGLFGVELKPVGSGPVAAFFNGLQLFGMGWSWGGFESLAVTTKLDRTVPGGYRPAGPLLRFHAGLEDPDDLIADLTDGFARLNATA